MGKGISRKLKDLVWRRDGGCCFYCGAYLCRSHPERTLDHVIPKSKGGANRMWNLVTACRMCNAEKGDTDPIQEHVAIILTRKRWEEIHLVLGRAIGQARLAGFEDDVQVLISLQNLVWEKIHGATKN